MIGPQPLAVTQYKVGLKPAAGYEAQLYVSTQQSTEPAIFALAGLNSGVLTPNIADAAILAAGQQELVAVLNEDIYATSNLVLTVTGTDQFAAAYTGTATFKPPAYSNNQERIFPRGFAVDCQPTIAGQKCAVVTGVSVVCDAQAAASGAKISLLGLPSWGLAPGTIGEYKLVSDKVSLSYDPRVPQAHAVQSGRDKSKYVKKGEIPEGAISITTKVGGQGDGLMRYNGVRVTGLVREFKEGQVETSRTVLTGLVITSNLNTGESVEDVTATGRGLFEVDAVLIAG